MFKSLEPFDLMDIPPIEESAEPLDLPPIAKERKKIADFIDL